MEPSFDLWSEEPEGWLRERGRTRALIIDDQYSSRRRWFDVAEDAPPTPFELHLRRWLNVDLAFLPMPDDYEFDMRAPRGTFDRAWFARALERTLAAPAPISIVFLDLLFGSQKSVDGATGPRILGWLRERLPEVPIVIFSSIEATDEVVRAVKTGGTSAGQSFQDYLPKRDPKSRLPLTERLAAKVVEWADLSDPAISAYSQSMRRLAREMRRIVLLDQRVAFEEREHGTFPAPVSLEGEFGSGKNYLASRLRALSRRLNAPFLHFNFANAVGDEAAATALFGTGLFTGAMTALVVRRSDGAVLREVPVSGGRVKSGNDTVILAQLGFVHGAHIGHQSFGSEAKPLQGTVLLDELGEASESIQAQLLRIFNRGRFQPHLGTVELPRDRPIDVWFLVTIGPNAQARMRPDLAMRLAKGHHLVIPPLRSRREDILPIAVRQVLGPPGGSLAQAYTGGAQDWLEARAVDWPVRQLVAVLGQLPSVTTQLPYSEGDLEAAFVRVRRTAPPRPMEPVSPGSGSAGNGVMLPAAGASPVTPAPTPVGSGGEILAQAEDAILDQLERTVRDALERHRGKELPYADIYERFFGERAKDTSAAQTGLARLILLHPATSRRRIAKSDRLNALARGVNRRRSLDEILKPPTDRDEEE